MKVQTLFILTIIGMILLACNEKAELIPKEYPQFVTNKVSNINRTGATFTAEVFSEGIGEILDFGFTLEWDEPSTAHPGLSYKRSMTISIADQPLQDSMHYDCRVDLKSDRIYTVNSYAETESFHIVGHEVRFKSKGSMSPDIHDFQPANGKSGAEVKISGNYFSHDKGNFKVELNDVPCELLYVSVDTLRVKIPSTIPVGSYPFKVTNVGGSGWSEQTFTVY